MGLYDTFWAEVECPYREHKAEIGFQTKAFSDRMLRNAKIGEDVTGWTVEGVDEIGVHARLDDGRHEVLLLDGIGDCDKCGKINSVVGLATDYGSGEPFFVLADIVLMDKKFVGIAHVRDDADYFRRVVLKLVRVPREPPFHWGKMSRGAKERREREQERYDREIKEIETRLKLKPYTIWRASR